jgi:phosphoserine phosphatase
MRKKAYFLVFLMGVTTLLGVSCIIDNDSNSDSLDPLNWSEKNYQVLNQMIENYGIGGKNYNEEKPPYAVLDWDQTCAHFDVEEALMRYQLFNLRYKLTKDEFADLLLDDINGVTQLSEEFGQITLANINQDLISDYNFLYDHFIGSDKKMNIDEIKATPQYNDFVVKIPFLYDGYCATTGIEDEYGYPWVLYLLAGQTIDEVKAMAKEAISYELSNQLSKQTLKSPADFPTKAGTVSYTYKSGLRVISEMQNLISTFTNHGIDVFIVSASYKPVVEVFSGIGNFGYNVASDHVIGMELALNNNGIIIPEYKAGWIKTFRQGKVEAINKVIKTDLKMNWDPLFSAGDSDGDYDMLTSFPNMKLSLIWNRVKGGDIGELCSSAVEQSGSSSPRYILQGRNENTGIVMPCSESILLGQTELKLLH